MIKFFGRKSSSYGNFDETDYYDDSTECVICSPFTPQKTGKHMLSSYEWDYYYCYSCKNWFRIADRNKTVFSVVNDKGTVSALNAYYASSLQEIDATLEATGLIHSLFGKIEKMIQRFVVRHFTPY